MICSVCKAELTALARDCCYCGEPATAVDASHQLAQLNDLLAQGPEAVANWLTAYRQFLRAH